MGECGVPEAFEGYIFTEMDKKILRMKDEDYRLLSWEWIKEICATMQLDELTRTPSELRRYLAWSAEIKRKHGSVVNFLLAERLPKAWGAPPFSDPVDPTSPLNNPADHRILLNDWPYGTAPGITHLVVWLRRPLPENEGDGEVSPEGVGLIEEFVERTFARELAALDDGKGPDRTAWFKNWASRQSVRALPHFHVMLRDAPGRLLEAWTRGED